MKRSVFLSALSVVLLLCSSMATASEKKLGYGFEPGLVSGKDFVAGQLIVGLKEGMVADEVKGTAAAIGAAVAKEMEGAILLQFASEEAVASAIPGLTGRADVAFVERNGFMSIPPLPPLPAELKAQKKGAAAAGGMKVASVSADIGTGYQWHLTVIRKTAALPALSATPPTVAVLDTGVDYTHSDLSGKVYLGMNAVAGTMDPMDDHGHGTHCAGIIGARAGNVFFGEGVCPNCKILAVKVLTAAGWGTFFDIASGMSWTILNRNTTVPPTKVVNMSLGGPASALVAAQVLNMKNVGMALAAAAGNSNSSTVFSYPGADANAAFRVMSTEENDSRSWFSNFSPAATPTRYNIAAPGSDIYSTVLGEGFTQMSGTSMATPVVAGAAALVWGQIPGLTRDLLVTRLTTNGKLISKGFAASTRRVDVRKAITGAAETGLVGRVLDPFNGLAASPNTTPDLVRLFNGAAVVGTDATNKAGAYEMTALATTGARTIKASRPAVAGSPALPEAIMRNVTIGAGVVTGPYTDAKPRARVAGNASITLDWWTTQPISNTVGCTGACNGWDFDLFVRAPSGTLYFYGNNGDLVGSPFVFYPRDSLDDYEPTETTVIGAAAANGVYKIFVDRYPYASSFNPSWTGSLASVQVFTGAALFQNYQTAPAACGAFRYWYVGDLTKNGAAYVWTNRNVCQAASP